MPEPVFDLKQVKLKTSPELSPAEKEFLISNKDSLNDEDKAAYADWLPEEISGIKHQPEENPALKTSVSGEGEGETPTGDEGEGGEGGEGEETTTPEETKPQYATREDVVSAIDHAFEKLTPFLTKQEVKEQKQEMKKTLFEDGKKYTLEEAAKLIQEDTVRKVREEMAKESKQRVEAANADVQKWVNQYNELAKEVKLPALNTKEGQDMWKKLDEIGGREGLTTFKQAYRFYELEQKASGAAATKSEEDTKKEAEKAKLAAQKKAAGRVSGGKGAETVTKGQKKYADIHVPLHQYVQSH